MPINAYRNRWSSYGDALAEGQSIGRYNRGVERQDRIRTEDIERRGAERKEDIDWRTKQSEKEEGRYQQGVMDAKTERMHQREREAKADATAEEQRAKAEEERKIRIKNLKMEQDAKKIALDQHYDRMEWLASGGSDIKATEALLSKGMRDGKQAKLTTNADGSYSIQIFAKDGKPLGTPKPFASDADEFQAMIMKTLGDESYSKAYYENKRKRSEKDEEAIDPDKIVTINGVDGYITKKGFKPLAKGIVPAKKKEPGFYDKENYKQIQKQLGDVQKILTAGADDMGRPLDPISRKKLEMQAKDLKSELSRMAQSPSPSPGTPAVVPAAQPVTGTPQGPAKKPPLPLDVPAAPPVEAGITGAVVPGGQPEAIPGTESGSGYNPQDPNTWNVIQQGSDLYVQTPAGPEKMTPEQVELWKQTEAGASYFQPIINSNINLNPERRRQGISKSFVRTPPMVR